MKNYAPIVVRLGTGLVVLWFGINQLLFPEVFLGYAPSWIPATTGLIMVNGVFEIFLGVLLLIGLFTRVVAFVHGLHLLVIIIGLGYNEIAVRDFGLMLAAFSVFLYGPHSWCIDKKSRKK